MERNMFDADDFIASNFFNNGDINLNKLLLYDYVDNIFGEKDKNVEKDTTINADIKSTNTTNKIKNKIDTTNAICNRDTSDKKPEKEEKEKKEEKEEKEEKENVEMEKKEEKENVEMEKKEEPTNQLPKKNTNSIKTVISHNEKSNNSIVSTTADDVSKTEYVLPDGTSLNIHNIICSVNLGSQLDLRLIAISVRNAEYNPQKANTLIMRLRKPGCTALIFQTGRIMLTGTNTIKDAIFGCKKVGKIIKKVTNKTIVFQNFKIENMIATADCNMPVRLEIIAQDHKEYCNYEPELFAGLIFRYNPTGQQKYVILVFVSGKMVILGCKSTRKLYSVFHNVYNVLKSYKDQ